MYAQYRADAFPTIEDVTVAELPPIDAEAPLYIDCREPEEQAVSMIEGAITKAEFEANLARYRGRRIVPYCTIGYRSGVYTRELRDRGLEAANLIGGVLEWAHAGRPFVDSDGARTHRVHTYGAKWDLLPSDHSSVYPGKKK